jgi:dihydroorotate dehydrogenase electron transfer subunit
VQVRAEVVATSRAGAYHRLAVAAPEVAARALPGQFIALAVGGPGSALLLRRTFAIHRAIADGPQGGTVEVIYAVHGRGTAWLADRAVGDFLDVVGPLGRGFTLPETPRPCTLVGGGYGSAPLFPLAAALRAGGCRVDLVLGAASADRLFGAADAAHAADAVLVTTEDGSAGERGRVTDVLPDVLRRSAAGVVYACGPMGMLAAVSALASAYGVPSECAVEESMACGIGVCMTCVLPVRGDDGATRMVRSCVEGPVFRGDRVRWDAVGTVPPDTVGAAPALRVVAG